MDRNRGLEQQYRAMFEALNSQFEKYMPLDALPDELAGATQELTDTLVRIGDQLADIAAGQQDAEAGDVLVGLMGIELLMADKAAAMAVLFDELPNPYGTAVPDAIRDLAHTPLAKLASEQLEAVAPLQR